MYVHDAFRWQRYSDIFGRCMRQNEELDGHAKTRVEGESVHHCDFSWIARICRRIERHGESDRWCSSPIRYACTGGRRWPFSLPFSCCLSMCTNRGLFGSVPRDQRFHRGSNVVGTVADVSCTVSSPSREIAHIWFNPDLPDVISSQSPCLLQSKATSSYPTAFVNRVSPVPSAFTT